jgi:hypothetical protein
MDPIPQLPVCSPGDTVAVAGKALLDEIGAHYRRLGADVSPFAAVGNSAADLILLDFPGAEQLRLAEVAVRPGGTIVIRGRPADDASLSGPDAVLSELRVEFVRDDAD